MSKNKNVTTSENQDNTAAPTPAGPQVNILEHYLKSIHFDNYRPKINATDQPKSELVMNVDSVHIVDDTFEVSIGIKVDMRVNDAKMFSISFVYTGVCIIEGLTEQEKEIVLNTQCPHMIYPFARKMLADITREGGYQPVLLNMVDFTSLYKASKEKQKAN